MAQHVTRRMILLSGVGAAMLLSRTAMSSRNMIMSMSALYPRKRGAFGIQRQVSFAPVTAIGPSAAW
jgi:hypothetical protein